jgi:endonuclease/exonuclease/phosphatase family metal-dependent hydrolase
MSRWSRYIVLVLIVVALGVSLGRRALDLLRQKLAGEVTVATLNVQTLFDGEYDGHEFREFNPLASSWSAAAYRERVTVLAEAIESFTPRGAPDLLALQEIEDETALSDLATAVDAGHYPYLLCAPGSTAMRVCLASRFPILSARAHGLHASTEYPLRSFLEAHIDSPSGRLTIVVAHWKSARGGREETAALRRLAARSTSRVVGRLLKKNAAARVIVAGDLNQEIEAESTILGPSPTAALRVAPAPDGGRHLDGNAARRNGELETVPVLYSPWPQLDGGSYVYRGEEQRIDHLLFSAGFFAPGVTKDLSYRGAHLVDTWARADGSPARYEHHSGRGVTDHFGLCATLVRADSRAP